MKFEHKFEYQWGGKDTWYTKSKRWANKQKFPVDYLALSVIEWVWLWWTDAKTKAEMAKVDVQAEEIKEEARIKERAKFLQGILEEAHANQ